MGGQALNFWSAFYAHRIPTLRVHAPLTSQDIDFVGPRKAAETLAERLGGELTVASIDHATANYAVVHFRDRSGHTRLVDFLERICGVEPKDLERTALDLRPIDPDLRGGASAFRLRIMHPVVCLESRLSNVVELPGYRTRHGLLQARMSVHCARAFLMDLADQGEVRGVRKLNERIYRFSRGRVGRAAYLEFRVDAMDAVLADHRLGERFTSTRYPQMLADIARRRGEPHMRRFGYVLRRTLSYALDAVRGALVTRDPAGGTRLK